MIGGVRIIKSNTAVTAFTDQSGQRFQVQTILTM